MKKEVTKKILIKLKNIDFKLIVILAFALFLRLYFFVGIGGNDDFVYSNTAWNFANHGFSAYPFEIMASLRLMVVVPLSILYRIFGASNVNAGTFPLFCSLLSIILTYKIGKLIFGEKTALLSAFLYSIFPLEAVYATQLVPSIPLTLFWLLSIYSFLCAEKKSPFLGLRISSNIMLLLSGVFWGCSYLANISGVFLAPFFVIYIILNRKFRKEYILILVGFLPIFMAENILYYFYRHEWLWRLKVGHEEEIRVNTNTALNYYPRVLFRVIDPNFFSHEGHFGLFAYLFVLLLPYLIYRRDKKSLVFAVFVLSIFAYMQFGIMTTTGRPMIKWMRYLIRFVPFTVLLISRAVVLLLKDFKFKAHKVYYWYVSLFALTVTIFTTPYYLVKSWKVYEISFYDFHRTYEYLETQPRRKIYTDWGTLAYIDTYSGYRYETYNIDSVNLPEDIKDAYVIVDGSRVSFEHLETMGRFPLFIQNHEIPENWELLLEIVGPGEDAYGFYNPKIYCAP
ncbi:glycosyltransferase family 39 protein [Candidatus Dojkabacteria bacterium]|nr:glycosyltransferase family 39 protein [Candidatus Dojkabacteria bacterium]